MVYGDTDSLFVHLPGEWWFVKLVFCVDSSLQHHACLCGVEKKPGRSLDEARAIGMEIAQVGYRALGFLFSKPTLEMPCA